jgi:hypothetical protein
VNTTLSRRDGERKAGRIGVGKGRVNRQAATSLQSTPSPAPGSSNWREWDRGKPRGSSPSRCKLRRSQVPFGLYLIRPWKAPRKGIGWRMANHESRALYCPRSRFGPSSATGLIALCWLLLRDQSILRYLQPRFRDTQQTSRGKLYNLPHATAEFTTSAFDEYGLGCHWPTRPAPYASDPALVHRLVRLLHASSGPHLSHGAVALRYHFTSIRL